MPERRPEEIVRHEHARPEYSRREFLSRSAGVAGTAVVATSALSIARRAATAASSMGMRPPLTVRDFPIRFGPGFLIGAATAPEQHEGDLPRNDWYEWTRPRHGRISDDGVPDRGVEFYRRYRDDLAMFRAFGHRAHRFGVEWQRIEPVDGGPDAPFDREQLAHYADMVAVCRRLGMEPVVTLQHFTLPNWLADRGGVFAPDAPERFGRYCAAVAQALGDVKFWITINEPNVLASASYLSGVFPPGERSLVRAIQALGCLVRMHAAGAQAVRNVAADRGRRAYVSVAHHERPIMGKQTYNDAVAAWIPDGLFNAVFIDACQRQSSDWQIATILQRGLLGPVGPLTLGVDALTGIEGPVPGARLDYLGVNYYGEERVRLDLSRPSTLFAADAGSTGGPDDSVIPPLQVHLQDLYARWGLPLFITENGYGDPDGDLRGGRVHNIVRSLIGVHQARRNGVPVLGYIEWTAINCFEWLQGWESRMGLFDRDRVAKQSAHTLREISDFGGITRETFLELSQAASTQTALRSRGGSPRGGRDQEGGQRAIQDRASARGSRFDAERTLL